MGCGCGVVYRNYSGGVEIGFLSDYKRDRCIKPLVSGNTFALEKAGRRSLTPALPDPSQRYSR